MLHYFCKLLIVIGIMGVPNAEAGKAEYLELAAMLSNANHMVAKDVALFKSNRKEYFKIHEKELLQRAIESPEEISPSIALIDSLKSIKYMLYADYKEDALQVLEKLNALTHGKLTATSSCEKLVLHIKEKGRDVAISNCLEGSESSYLFQCITDANYKLVMIDEDSDAFPLTLVPLENFEAIKKLALKSAIKIKGLEAEGLKL